MKRLITLFALAFLLIAGADARGQGQIYPPYDDNYQFGANGNANDPNGKDGWPADHPNNPNFGTPGKGGNGSGDGNGGKGGDAMSPGGGQGGEGGQSGPNGGCGGEGGKGGDNNMPNSTGGTGGKGGNGVDCGGKGGQGGSGTSFGGQGGCGGNATGPGGRGGNGGKGGSATTPNGIGGQGGCGGNANGPNSCGGTGGEGGDAHQFPGPPGTPGQGAGNGDKPCFGNIGNMGIRRPVAPLPAPIIAFAVRYTPGLENLSLRDGRTLGEVVPMIHAWHAKPGSGIDFATRAPYEDPQLADGRLYLEYVLHPESVAAERLRFVAEYRPTGFDQFHAVGMGDDGDLLAAPSLPVPIGDGWLLREFVFIRPVAGEPMGNHLDHLVYLVRDIEVRSLEVHDFGPKGDVNFDGVVDEQDLQIVGANMFATGDLGIEDGDTDLSGAVDASDAMNVLQGLTD